MKTKLLKNAMYAAALLLTIGCYPSDSSTDDFQFNPGSGSTPCGSYNGNKTYTGPKGGCYYYNSNGNKTYVDKKYCC